MTTVDETTSTGLDQLRAIVTWFEQHPEFEPCVGGIQARINTKAELAALARALPGTVVKDGGSDSYFIVRAWFGDSGYIFGAVDRELVCRKVVTGKRVVPAEPEREVEVVEWICDEPILAASLVPDEFLVRVD